MMLTSLPSLRLLRAFEAVARLESVTRASAEIHLTQPAVTQAIARLESEINERLFERRTTGTYLTAFGQIYLRRTRRLFEEIEKALTQISGSSDRTAVRGKLTKLTRTQIRSHVTIAQSRSFAHASRALGISEASLHRAARDLERVVGVPLYRHTVSGVVTTEAGEALATRLLLAINEIECVAEDVRAAKGVIESRVAVGALMLDQAPLIAAVMVEFTRRYPHTHVQLVHGTFEHLQHRLRAGLLDLIVGVLKTPEADLAYEPLFRDPYVIAVRRGHPLTRCAQIRLQDLLEYDWVVPNQMAPRRAAFEQLFARLGEKPNASIETHSLATIRETLFRSDRMTLLTRSEMAVEARAGNLSMLPFGTLDPVPTVGVTTRSNWLPSEGARAFLQLLRECAQEQQLGGELPLRGAEAAHTGATVAAPVPV